MLRCGATRAAPRAQVEQTIDVLKTLLVGLKQVLFALSHYGAKAPARPGLPAGPLQARARTPAPPPAVPPHPARSQSGARHAACRHDTWHGGARPTRAGPAARGAGHGPGRRGGGAGGARDPRGPAVPAPDGHRAAARRARARAARPVRHLCRHFQYAAGARVARRPAQPQAAAPACAAPLCARPRRTQVARALHGGVGCAAASARGPRRGGRVGAAERRARRARTRATCWRSGRPACRCWRRPRWRTRGCCAWRPRWRPARARAGRSRRRCSPFSWTRGCPRCGTPRRRRAPAARRTGALHAHVVRPGAGGHACQLGQEEGEGSGRAGRVSAAARAQEGALTLQLFQLFCDVLVKTPAMEAVLVPVFARLIQARPQPAPML